MKIKEKHSKLDNITYSELKVQPYLTDMRFHKEERQLIVLLRSRCHNTKNNFKKLYKNDLLCSYGCQVLEDQIHKFTQCKTLRQQITISDIPEYTHLFNDVNKQKRSN